jgi:UDP-2,3-diacylglucosamine hydrolase
LLEWLRFARQDAKSVVVMGDLFDFWFAWKHVMPRRGFRILAALADLKEAGIPVLWMGGNHDCWHGDALERETGASYTLEPWRGLIGAWCAEIAHGDGLREREDAPYRRLRAVLRHPFAIRLFGWLHPDWATRLATSSSNTSRHLRAADDGRALLTVATRRLASSGAPDLVMHGHTHVPRLERAGRGVYANAGAWYVDRQFLRIETDTITRCEWRSGERHVLDTIDRVAEEPAP